METGITFKKVMEHIEVFCGTKFLFSADSEREARQELMANMTISN
jgi:hypothetical protein